MELQNEKRNRLGGYVIYVKVYNNNIEKVLSKFKKKVKESKLMVDPREREFYTKNLKRKEKII